MLPCDNVFVCSGVQSPFIVKNLGYRLPIIPLKGYTFTQKREKEHSFRYCHKDYMSGITVSNWKKIIRYTSFCTDIMGINYEIPTNRNLFERTEEGLS